MKMGRQHAKEPSPIKEIPSQPDVNNIFAKSIALDMTQDSSTRIKKRNTYGCAYTRTDGIFLRP